MPVPQTSLFIPKTESSRDEMRSCRVLENTDITIRSLTLFARDEMWSRRVLGSTHINIRSLTLFARP
ncbi:MAG: hypothetical protein HYV95_13375 [Opitutae bacterium]|nr:hypothetical protein [Opitutae bacterium]